jgi:hypothetical protein
VTETGTEAGEENTALFLLGSVFNWIVFEQIGELRQKIWGNQPSIPLTY